ncbi:MAG TPA: VOC family protein [Jatrophihabitans sp.]|nr:VOC family protein [Jatrophihabitans sp.]
MVRRTSYPAGMPCWTDLQAGDVAAAKQFYQRLFGWDYDDRPTPTGDSYALALVDSDVVAAIAPKSPMQPPAAPAVWSSYLAADDVDAAVAAAGAHGGSVLAPAADIPGSGRMAFVADPAGIPIGLWQAGGRIGADRVNEPGALVWNELSTDQLSTVLPFYAVVAGLVAVPAQLGETEYTVLNLDERSVAGATRPARPELADRWLSWFGVADADRAAATARQAGGTVLIEPERLPVGIAVTLRDPQGAVFGVLQDTG